MEDTDYRAHYNANDTLQNKLIQSVIAVLPQSAFNTFKEFNIRVWIDVYGQENFIDVRTVVGSNKTKADAISYKKIAIFRDKDNNHMLALHTAKRMGLDVEDQIVSITTPRICDIMLELLDEFTSFRER